MLFSDAPRLCSLLKSLILNTNAAAQLCFGLQILPITHQVSCISGLPWNKCLRSNRSERVEYYLLHGFTQLGFIVPDKNVKTKMGKRKSKYEGGLVLEPKAGLYEEFIVVLDFNSLYPSIIQEFNLCYTTVERTKKKVEEEKEKEGNGRMNANANAKETKTKGREKEEDEDNEINPVDQDGDGDVVVSSDAEFKRRYCCGREW